MRPWRVRRIVPVLLWATVILLAGGVAFAAGKNKESGRAQHSSAAVHSGDAHSSGHSGSTPQGEHEAGHAAGGHHEIGEVNWVWGLLSESEDPGEEPTLLVRPKGMPVPVAAQIFNTLVLFWLLAALGKKPLRQALRQRKERIMQGIEDASRMKAEASTRLEEYEARLSNIDAEIERIKLEMRAAAESERQRILEEAEERRKRMERDAHLLFEQELKAAREELRIQTVEHAVKAAENILMARVDAATDQKQQADYLQQVESVATTAWRGHS